MPLCRGDSRLHITFNEMGHGDNVLISLPNGKMVVIDCGSMRWDGNYWLGKPKVAVLRDSAMKNALGDERFLLTEKVIDLLVLTHPDKDHCIELKSLFENFTVKGDDAQGGSDMESDVTYEGAAIAKQVFYSATFKEYGDHGVPKLLLEQKKAGEIYSLTINQQGRSYSKVKGHTIHGTEFSSTTQITASAKDTSEILKTSSVAETLNFVRVLDGSVKGGVACDVYFLASNVIPYNNVNDSSSPDNRGSIVTMIIYGDKKFLFMGDSTFNTECFLLETYGNLIKDVEVLHVPHHASSTTSSYEEFVKKVNPRYAVVTAAWDSGQKLGLPRYEILDRYHNRQDARLGNKPNDVKDEMKTINCYQKQKKSSQHRTQQGQVITKTWDENVLVQFKAPKLLWCTGSHGPIDCDYEEKGGKEPVGPVS